MKEFFWTVFAIVAAFMAGIQTNIMFGEKVKDVDFCQMPPSTPLIWQKMPKFAWQGNDGKPCKNGSGFFGDCSLESAGSATWGLHEDGHGKSDEFCSCRVVQEGAK